MALMNAGLGGTLAVSIPAFINVTPSGATGLTNVTATVSGAVGSVSYVWSFSGDAGTSIDSLTDNPATVRATGLISGEAKSCNVSVMVTDMVTGQTAFSAGCHITFTRT